MFPKTEIYDRNPDHLWNRLYAGFYARAHSNGAVFGLDELDPLLWPSSTYLLTEPRIERLREMLDEFLFTSGEQLISDPVKRICFQHDLWAMYDWLANVSNTSHKPPDFDQRSKLQ
jgi:hypothetical protein